MNEEKIVVDANFVMTPHELKIDVFGETKKLLGRIEWIVPGPVLEELKFMADKGQVGARVGLEMLEKEGYEVVDAGGPADGAVIEVARRLGGRVASMDGEVRRRARKYSLKLVGVRGRQKVVLD